MNGKLFKNNMFGFLLIIIIVLLYLASLYSDWLWFDSLGYVSVFKTILLSKIALGVAVFLSFFIVLYLNFILLRRRFKIQFQKIYFTVIFAISLLAGIFSSSYWFTVLKFLNFVGFGFVDPVFENDIGFYIFVLPFYEFIIGLVFFLLLAALVLVLVISFLSGSVKKPIKQEPKQGTPFGIEQPFQQVKIEIPEKGRAHMAYLAGVLLLVVAVFFYLQRYSILFSQRGAVYGAGFTDVIVSLPD